MWRFTSSNTAELACSGCYCNRLFSRINYTQQYLICQSWPPDLRRDDIRGEECRGQGRIIRLTLHAITRASASDVYGMVRYYWPRVKAVRRWSMAGKFGFSGRSRLIIASRKLTASTRVVDSLRKTSNAALSSVSTIDVHSWRIDESGAEISVPSVPVSAWTCRN